MKYRIVERRFGGKPIIVGDEKLPGIVLADPLYPAWNYELATPVLISDADTDFWANVEDVSPADRKIIVDSLGGENEVQECLQKAVRLHTALSKRSMPRK